MSDAVIAQKFPYMTDLETGKDYFWCACGKSGNQPFCDGSHKGTDFTPVKFNVDKAKPYTLCDCKHNDGQPYCNGPTTNCNRRSLIHGWGYRDAR